MLIGGTELPKIVKENRELLWFLIFPIKGSWYLITQMMPLEYTVIESSLDKYIPFIPEFIIPYLIWFLYVPGLMVYVYLKDRSVFKRQALLLSIGMAFCAFVFVVFPTSISLRPTISDSDGFFVGLCAIIYSNDNPVNVFPSLHCFEAVAVHIATFSDEKFKNQLALRISSSVLVVMICLSTVFIKQHSIIDVIGGILLAVVIQTILKNTLKSNSFMRKQFESE